MFKNYLKKTTIMEHIKKYIKACRPVPSSLVVFPISMAIAFGYSYCSSTSNNHCEEFNIPLTIICSIVSLLLFQYGFIINSVIDYLTGIDDDQTFDRTLFDSNNSLGDLYKYCFGIISIVFLSCVFPIYWFSKSIESYWLLIKLISFEFFFSSTYTFSKYIGLGGFFVAFCYCIPVSYIYLALTNQYISIFEYSHPLMICSLIYIFYGHTAIVSNCIRDHETDEAAGIYTITRILGLKQSILFLLSLYLSVIILQFYLMLTYGNYFFLLVLITFSMNLISLYKKYLEKGRPIINWGNGIAFLVPFTLFNLAVLLGTW
ncbi:hypothetical protein RB653_007367 [Dictyostelium firmibasis]|uniref:Uncharacterized protein n=1 Tax=Dictyostelium firmibasis TaxID=79012 RepID=A0AAN7YNY6_9MYCE